MEDSIKEKLLKARSVHETRTVLEASKTSDTADAVDKAIQDGFVSEWVKLMDLYEELTMKQMISNASLSEVEKQDNEFSLKVNELLKKYGL